ncbi:MAG: hypothetical protein AB1405_03330 [Bdellovibrionota bacterium]
MARATAPVPRAGGGRTMVPESMPTFPLRSLGRYLFAAAWLVLFSACGGGAGTSITPPAPLSITAFAPADLSEAPTNTLIIVGFNQPVDLASLEDGFQLLLVDTAAAPSETPVAVTRRTDWDGASDGTWAVFDPDADLEMNLDAPPGTRFYRIQIAEGTLAASGGELPAVFTSNFGTAAGPTTSLTFPAALTVSGLGFGNPVYRQQPDFTLSGNLGNSIVLLTIDADDGGGLPGELLPILLPGITALNDELIEIPGAAPPEAEETYTITLTFYDLAGNSAMGTFTFVYDSTPPPAPSAIDLAAGETSPTSNPSVNVEVEFPGTASDMGIQRLQVTGGSSAVTVNAGASPQTISVDLQENVSNSLSARSLDAAGNVSPSVTPSLVVVHDSNPPGISFSFSPALAAGAIPYTRVNTTSFLLSGQVSGEPSSLIELLDVTSSFPGTLIDSVTASGSFAIPFTLTANVQTDLQVRVSDVDQPGNTQTSATFAVFPDTEVNPLPEATQAFDDNGECLDGANPSRSQTCLRYSASPPGFRASIASVTISGNLEKESTLQIRPTGLFSTTTSDDANDVFPASGNDNPKVNSLAGIVDQVEFFATDSVGNEATVSPGMELIVDPAPPLGPEIQDAAGQGTCSSTLTAGPPAILRLTGTFASNCQAVDFDVDVTDDPANPDPTRGETLSLRIYDDGTPAESASQPVPVPATDPVNFLLTAQLPSAAENAISNLYLSSFDAVTNESNLVQVVVIHQTDANDLLKPLVEQIVNAGGGHDGEALLFATTTLVTTRPTNATSITLSGRTSPNATSVELHDEFPPSGGAIDTATPDPVTGAFSFTGIALTANGTIPFNANTFTIRAIDADEQEDLELEVQHDTRAPTTAVSASVSSPQGGSTGPVTVTVSNLKDPAGLNEVAAVVHRYSDATCTTDLSTQTGVFLDEADPVTATITATVGNYLRTQLVDEAGNAGTQTDCDEVKAGNQLVALVQDNDPILFNLDAVPPTAQAITEFPNDDVPTAVRFYSGNRIFFRDTTPGGINLINYVFSSSGGAIEQTILRTTGNDFDTRLDRQLLALLSSASGAAALETAPVDSAGLIGSFGAQIPIPGWAASGKIPARVILFPDSAEPQGDWALVLRWNQNILASPPLPGDALVFDLATGLSVVPDPPISPSTEAGLLLAPLPIDAAIRPDGKYAIVAASSAVPGDGSLPDLTILNFSSCPSNCTTADFAAVNVALTNGDPVNGLVAVHLLPGSSTLALAVESSNEADTGGTLLLVTIDWNTPANTAVTAALPFSGKDLENTLAILSDGSEAIVLAGNQLLRIAIDSDGPTYLQLKSGDGDPIDPTPSGAFFEPAIQAQP